MDREDFFRYIKGKSIALCGIGRSHIPLAGIFAEHGARVTARDRRSAEELGGDAEKLKALGVRLILGEDYLKGLDEDIIFRTPGMKYYMQELIEARKNGSAVTSETEVFMELCPCKIYAVTGSDGKTTTTTIISEFLRAQGRTVHLGGNIGKPLLPEIDRIKKEDAAVIELSSFQLISMRRSADVAVVTNVAPNHLDVHRDMQEYIEAKKNVFLHQSAFSRTVLNLDNDITAAFAEETRGETLFFSRRKKPQRGLCFDAGSIYAFGEKLLESKDIKLPGLHNIENYMAAIAAVWGEVRAENIRRVAAEFGGVEHRMEFVRELDGVKYYNDSIGTSPSRTINGTLSAYDGKIVLIAGGYDKHIPYDPLGPVINEKVKVLILMGATADKIESAVRQAANFNPDEIEILHVENMEQAVNEARARASKGDVVSLSPASAGFDLYPNFEVRGRHFKELVNRLE